MKLWKPIVGFVTHKKVLSSVIGIAMVGSVSAAAVAANNGAFTSPTAVSSAASSAVSVEDVAVQLESSETSSAVSSTISSSTPASSAASSAVSSKPSSVASSTPSKTSTVSAPTNLPSAPSSSKPDNTAARSAALSAETTRHNNALSEINSQYDPKISAAQTENQDVLNQNAVNLQATIRNIREQAANAGNNNPDQIEAAINRATAAEQQEDQKIYDKRAQDVKALTVQKQSFVDIENNLHTAKVDNINLIYP